MLTSSARQLLCFTFLVFSLATFAHGQIAPDGLDIQVQSVDGRLVTGVGVVDEVTEITIGVSVGERVFPRELGANFSTINPGFNVEPDGSLGPSGPLLPPGVNGIGEDTSVFLEYVPSTLDGVTSPVFYWDGVEANPSDNELTFDDIELSVLDGDRGFAFVDFTGTPRFADPNETGPHASGLIQTTTVTEQIGAVTVPGGRLHEHRRFAATSGGIITASQPAGLFVVSLQLSAAGFESSDPFYLVFHSTLESPDGPQFPPVIQFEEEAALLAAFVDASIVDGLPGDYNLDTLVTAADYAVWRDGAAPDTSLDGYDEWAAAFGDGVAPAVASTGTSVPEPVSLGMIAVATAVLALGRRQRSGP